MIRVIRAGEQPIDQVVPFVWAWVVQKGPRLLRSGQSSRHVDGHPTNKRRIITHLGGRHPYRLEFLKYNFVDKILRHRNLFHRRPQRDGGIEYAHFRVITDHDGHVSRL